MKVLSITLSHNFELSFTWVYLISLFFLYKLVSCDTEFVLGEDGSRHSWVFNEKDCQNTI